MAIVDVDLSAIGQPMDGANTTRRAFPTYTGPVLYDAGGDTGLAEACRMSKVFAVSGALISNGTAVLVGFWDAANAKLMWFVQSSGAEASGDLSLYSGTFEVIGQ